MFDDLDDKTVRDDTTLALANLRTAFAALATANSYVRHADQGGSLSDNRPSAAYSDICHAECAVLSAIRLLEAFNPEATRPTGGMRAAAAKPSWQEGNAGTAVVMTGSAMLPPAGDVAQFNTIEGWCRLTGMSRRVTYEKLGTRHLLSIKVGARTLIDVSHGLAYLRSLPAAQIRAPRGRKTTAAPV
jgi:hypothetical protein